MSQALHVSERFNPEEAAHAASEFVSSLDNLPGEVTFLLAEIKEKDTRINNLLGRINTRHFALTKHARSSIQSSRDKDPSGSNSASASGNGGTPPFPLPLPSGASLPTDHLSQKDAQGITKIVAEFAKVQALQEEKIALAERMERIVGRARERGRAEWQKVGGLDVEEVAKSRADEVRGREGGMVVLPSMGLGSGMDRPKKRKPHALPLSSSSFHNTQHTIHPPPLHASSSMGPPPAPRGPGRRRGDRHQSTATSFLSESDMDQTADPAYDPDADGDADADGEADVEGEEDAEGEAEDYDAEGEVAEADEGIYCTCGEPSYGEMIGCDNPDCEIEWYHNKCVNITGPVPETWYCPQCTVKMGLSGSTGRHGGRDKKGRKAR